MAMRWMVGVALALGGCAADKPGALVRSWSDNFNEYGIDVIFPPREDFQIGDVYVNYPAGLVATGRLPFAVQADRLNLLPAWAAHQSSQLFAKPQTTYEDGVFDQPVDDNQRIGTDPRTPNRLSLAAFPQLEIARVSAASLGLGATGSPLLAALGFSSSDEVSVKVTKTEQMSLPLRPAMARLDAWMADVRDPDSASAAKKALCIAAGQVLAELVARGVKPPVAKANLVVTVPLQVYYTRGLQYSTLESRATQVQASAILDDAATLDTLVKAISDQNGEQPAPPAGEGAEAAPAPAATPAPAPAPDQDPTQPGVITRAQLEELQRTVDSLSTQVGGFGAGGGAVNVRAASALGVSLTEDFQRPLAFGWRGVKFKADAFLTGKDCELDMGVGRPSGPEAADVRFGGGPTAPAAETVAPR